jgi:hypothetical protein
MAITEDRGADVVIFEFHNAEADEGWDCFRRTVNAALILMQAKAASDRRI